MMQWAEADGWSRENIKFVAQTLEVKQIIERAIYILPFNTTYKKKLIL